MRPALDRRGQRSHVFAWAQAGAQVFRTARVAVNAILSVRSGALSAKDALAGAGDPRSVWRPLVVICGLSAKKEAGR